MKILKSGLDRLEIFAWRNPAGRFPFTGRRESVYVKGLGPFEAAGSGGRNHKYRYQLGDMLNVLTEPRSDVQAASAGDMKIEILAPACAAWFAARRGPTDEDYDRINGIIARLGGVPETARIARIDWACDITSPRANRYRFPGSQVSTRRHNLREMTQYDDTDTPGGGTVYTGCRLGKDSGKGAGLMRIYRKDVELRQPGHERQRTDYAAAHGYTVSEDTDTIPPVWRIEYEMRGEVLTAYDCRELARMPLWLPALIRRQVGLEKTNAPGHVKHTGVIFYATQEHATIHPVWRALQKEVRAYGETITLRRAQTVTRRLSAAIEDAARAEQKAAERLAALVALAHERGIIDTDDYTAHRKPPREAAIDDRLSRARRYYPNEKE